MKKIEGFKEALEILKALGPKEQKTLLENIRTQDSSMADRLSSELVGLEDLKHLTTLMLVNFLKDIDLETFGLALRSIDLKISEGILSKVSTGIRLDIEDGLKGRPRSAKEVEEARCKVLEHLNNKMASGEVLIDPNDEVV